ncbi:hypothetical protein ABTW96_04345 [Nocardia beijingensis]|uniref:hypothetical protein n=1 Tax=Nocardia beijingensis TaxID=95162 RepID=UPI003325A32E
MGSVALADYRHGRSDVDVVIVVDPSLPAQALRDLAESLAHPALPCPAAGLELVVYGADFVAAPSDAAGYLMDLNTGPMLPNRVSFDPAESSAFWYVIDRSIAHQTGRLLYGTPVRQIMAAPSRRDVHAALLASVREHAGGAGHLGDNRVLNGCRAVAFCRTGRWSANAKPRRRSRPRRKTSPPSSKRHCAASGNPARQHSHCPPPRYEHSWLGRGTASAKPLPGQQPAIAWRTAALQRSRETSLRTDESSQLSPSVAAIEGPRRNM